MLLWTSKELPINKYFYFHRNPRGHINGQKIYDVNSWIDASSSGERTKEEKVGYTSRDDSIYPGRIPEG